METPTLLSQIADNWLLVGMFTFFIGVIVWTFLPSQAAAREDASMIPMRDEIAPKTSSGGCTDGTRETDTLSTKGLSNG